MSHRGVISRPVRLAVWARAHGCSGHPAGVPFRARPDGRAGAFLAACCGASRFWFNQGLALVKERLEQRAAGVEVDVPWSYKGLCVAFRGRRIKDQLAPWRGEVVTGSYQAGLEALGNALQNFSRARAAGRRVGFPRFRAKGRSHEAVIFQRPRITDNRHVMLDRRLGPLRTKESLRKLTRLLASDPNARVMRSTVQRTNGGWVISFAVQRSAKQRRSRRPNAVVGVDLGLARLATVSTGQQYPNARPLQAALRLLGRLQRQLARQRRANNPGNYAPDGRINAGPKVWVKSQRMLRTEVRIAKVHERVANLRRHQAHRLTTALTREYGVIGVETLAVKNLLANRRLARHIADVAWGKVLDQLRYKIFVVRRLHPGRRRPLLSLLEDVLSVRSSESQAAPGRSRLHLRRADMRARCRPRPQRGLQPRPYGGSARAGGGQLHVVRGPHRTVHESCARRAGKPRPIGRAQPGEARSVFGRIPAPRGAGCCIGTQHDAAGGWRLRSRFRARSSVGERSLHTREVAGSKPAAPIALEARYGGLLSSGNPPRSFPPGSCYASENAVRVLRATCRRALTLKCPQSPLPLSAPVRPQ